MFLICNFIKYVNEINYFLFIYLMKQTFLKNKTQKKLFFEFHFLEIIFLMYLN